MESFFCCFHDKDPGETANVSSQGNCTCPLCFTRNSFSKFAAFFRGGQMHALHSSPQEAASSTPNGAPAYTEPATILSHPGTLVSNIDFRSSNLQQDELVKGLNKGKGDSSIHSELSSSTHTGEELSTDSSLKFSLENTKAGDLYDDRALPEDHEDICPICLEEYIPENPKILTQCSHHYHLSCIYEWMERSETCPVCCQVLILDETN
ncbi:E3 ubiquitin-protein ligase At3g02290-like isoform X1 [Juglans microcarpa x Juglans regia]|uniref:E3 ubiquitin-protein ligase At3g02290-like isoform X1 n=1 Tax=Juglans microcarpa x Juglans regia TaxID=2249226 RepID=UPI001B7E5C02|nr:E3 ubiquitin-protein ligase At3g02290-like isoform X1 [Juglans microcarpa x Juglans regia]